MTFWLVLVVVKLFSWLIFIIGFVNFMKFMVQMFYTRQREIALRKCMGSDSKGLYALLASEVVLVLLLSFLVSCIVSELSLSYVKYMNLDFNMYVDFRLLFMLQLKATVIALAVGLVAVLFPVLRLRRVESQAHWPPLLLLPHTDSAPIYFLQKPRHILPEALPILLH